MVVTSGYIPPSWPPTKPGFWPVVRAICARATEALPQGERAKARFYAKNPAILMNGRTMEII